MPAVRNLTNTPEQPKPQPPAGALATLPNWALAQPVVPDAIPTGPKYNYVAMLSDRSTKLAALKAAGVNVGDWYIDTGSTVIPLKVFRYWMVQAEFFKTKMDSQGNVIAATKDVNNRDLEEHVVALVIVDTDTGCVPAKVDFRRTAWQAGGAGIEALKAAADPGYPSTSDAARVAAQFPAPFGRNVVTVTGQQRTSRSSGNRYIASAGTYQPASVSQIQKLVEAMQDVEFLEAMEDARKGFLTRCEMLQKLCK